MAYIFDTAGEPINPATSDQQDSIVSALNSTPITTAPTEITAGDATTPATWLGTLDSAQLTLTGTDNSIVIEATAAERTLYIAHYYGVDWNYLVKVVIPAYCAVTVPCPRPALAFGIAGGATVLVTPRTV